MNPEHSPHDADPSREVRPHEIEVKILDIGDVEAMRQKIVSLGATLVRERRLLRDQSYNRPKHSDAVTQTITVSTASVHDPDRFKGMMEFLGLRIIGEQDGEMQLECPAELPKRSARLRRDADTLTFTIKEPRNREQLIDDRIELETSLQDPGGVIELLQRMGYQVRSEREKYRTSYDLNGTLIEINEGPAGKPWLEVEGPSQEAVQQVVGLLGFQPQDMANISEGDMYERHGVPEEQIRRLKFSPPSGSAESSDGDSPISQT